MRCGVGRDREKREAHPLLSMEFEMSFYFKSYSEWFESNHILLNKTYPLFFQVISHLLMFMFSQFLVSILVILCEYCLNFCISMALPEIIERLYMNSFTYVVQPRDNKMQEERRNCWIRDSPPLTICFRKAPTSKNKKCLYEYLGQNYPYFQQFIFA